VSILHDLIAVAETAGLGTAASDLFAGLMPDAPDRCAAFQSYGGATPLRTVPCNTSHEQAAVQIAIRAPTYDDAEAWSYALWHALTFTNTTVGTTRYLESAPQQSPFLIRREQNARPILGFNLYIRCRPSR